MPAPVAVNVYDLHEYNDYAYLLGVVSFLRAGSARPGVRVRRARSRLIGDLRDRAAGRPRPRASAARRSWGTRT